MKRVSLIARIVFYLLFALYQLGAFAFTVMVDGHLDLFGLLKYIPRFKFIAAAGIFFLAIEVIWYFADRKKRLETEDELRHENELLNLKIRKLEDAANASESSKKS